MLSAIEETSLGGVMVNTLVGIAAALYILGVIFPAVDE
jgi:hypothetical protein